MSDTSFTGSVPALYDRYLGPLLFEPYAADIAARVAATHPRTVLELAAGTGIVTAALANALPEAAITATDLNPDMLTHAQTKGALSNVTFKVADAQSLPFEDNSFDALVCQFGVMFLPDKPKAYREMRRVVSPTGTVFFNVWDSFATNPIPDAVTAALTLRYPSDPPLFLRRTPYGYYTADPIRSALLGAGFTKVEIDTVTLPSESPSTEDIAVGFCQGCPLRSEIEQRDPDGLPAATAHVAAALKARYGTGKVSEPMGALVVMAS